MTRNRTRHPCTPREVINPRTVPFADPTSRGNLPHLYKEGCSYFVTFCLDDVGRLRRATKQRGRSLDSPEDLAQAFEPTTPGSCILKDADLSKIVEGALLFFQGERYALSAWCVMPNHVHAVVTPYGDHSLLDILHSWKSFTAHKINRRLDRTGRVWQQETFDHMIRSPESFGKFVRYTELNPVEADLAESPEDWPFSSARYRRSDDG